MELIYSGSVKDILGVKGESPYIFQYSDRYSVFDWGPLPDQLEGKGKSLATFAWFFFYMLETPKSWESWQPGVEVNSKILNNFVENGLVNHGLGLVDAKYAPLEKGDFSSNYAVRPVEIIHPTSYSNDGKLEWDYSAYGKKPVDCLVPLEVIFRFGIPKGSSLLKRVNKPGYLESLGLKDTPVVGDKFEKPIVEFSTKLESTDRYITNLEAKTISGMSDDEFSRLMDTVEILALRLKDIFLEVEIELWDGKFEFAFLKGADGSRDFMIVDSIGPDELRLTYDGVQLSKENLRQIYKNTEWYQATEKAKTMANTRGIENWKSICVDELNQRPPKLKDSDKVAMEMMYKGLCQTLVHHFTGLSPFPKAWSLKQIVEELR